MLHVMICGPAKWVANRQECRLTVTPSQIRRMQK